MANIKISFVGAGSVRYTLKLLGDIFKTKELFGVTISLMDIDEERLNATYVLAEKYRKELSADVKIEKTLSLEESIDSASFVINTALHRAKGHEDGYVQYEIMREIGEKHGYYRGIDSQEFNMVSDYYTLSNFNQLKLSLDIAKTVEKLSPKAYLLQTANPVFEITQLVSRETDVRIIGICHGFHGVYEVINTLNLDPNKVDWQIAGVNHGIFLNRFLYNGENAYKILDQWIEEKSHEWEPKDPWDLQLSPCAIDMYKFYGMLPIGDTVRNGTWKYHYNLETKKKWLGKFGGIDNEVERPKFYEQLRALRRSGLQLAKQILENPNINLTEILPIEFSKDKLSGEQQILFINAIVNNKEKRLFLNIPNNGTISELPKDVIVEVPCIVNKNGIFPEKIEPDLTERIKKMYLLPRILRMEWALHAFKTGDRRVLEEILIRDPRTKSYEQVKNVIDEILSLPFNEEMRKHYQKEE
ncbi:MAG: alpha-glucosidase/alpha-galactosidase [Dictyoglomus sp. NZ13-RE01]|nr:MAG: alpha-glucosidase/alpha-galactosidase [Dictyoglomus sp. NZ13-RE01]